MDYEKAWNELKKDLERTIKRPYTTDSDKRVLTVVKESMEFIEVVQTTEEQA